MQLAVHLLCLLTVHIVPLRGEDQVLCELRIPIDYTDAIQNVPKMKQKGFISNNNILSLEW